MSCRLPFTYSVALSSLMFLLLSNAGRAQAEPCVVAGNVTTAGKLGFIHTEASWFHEERYGIPGGILDRVTAKDQVFGDLLAQVLQKGWHDFSRAFCPESDDWCKLSELRGPRRRLRALVDIVRNGPYGEVYGNNRLLDGTPLTHMVSPGTEGPPPGVQWPRLRPDTAATIKLLLKHFRGLPEAANCSRALDAESTNKSLYYRWTGKGSYELLDSHDMEAISACQVCSRYGVVCRVGGPKTNLTSEVIALSLLLRPNVTLPDHLAAAAAPIPEVKALRVGPAPPGVIVRLSRLLPAVQALILTLDKATHPGDGPPDSISTEDPSWLGPWQHSVQGLGLSSSRSDAVDALVCSMRSLRWVDLSGIWSSLPPCLGKLSELTEMSIVRVHMNGPGALPPELSELKNLRSIHAFSQDDGDCELRPETWVEPPGWTGPKECTAGYLYSVGEEQEPAWRCPWRGWRESFDDPKAPWWGWERMERFHVDANFWDGQIPEDLDVRWPHLRSLDLHDNVMTGPLPTALLRLENLTQLQVQANQFSCDPAAEVDVVAELFKHPRMRTLNLDQNPELCGRAPSASTTEGQVRNTKISIEPSPPRPEGQEQEEAEEAGAGKSEL